MFVYTLRANSLRFFSVVGIALIVLVSLIVFIPTSDAATTAAIREQNESVRFDRIRNNDDRIAFLAQFGWEVEATPLEEVTLTIPSEFDRVLDTYNEIQKQQGLDLSRYRGKTVERYTYLVTNYPGTEGRVLANVIVSKKRVIGGDICSTDLQGFIHGFRRPE